MTDPSNINANLLTVMQSLTNAVNGLTDHVSRIGSSPLSASSASFNVTGGSTSSPVAQADANAALQANAQRQEQAALAQQTATDPGSGGSPTDSSRSTPTPGPNQVPSDINALTWEALGNLGGPLGRFRQGQYVSSQYQNLAGGLISRVGGATRTPQFEEDGTTPVLDEEGNQVVERNMSARLADFVGSSRTLNTGLTAVQSALAYGTQYSSIGQALGYGNRIGLFGMLRGQEGNFMGAATEGARLRIEQANLHMGGGLTSDQSRSIVDALAAAGFSNQNPDQGGVAHGDNALIASQVSKPLVQQGVSAEGATEWATALRNAGTNVQALTTSLQGMATAAQATKETTDQYNSSLLEFAQSQVANGGTQSQAAQTGMDFTAATGMAPGIFAQLQNSPVYQGLMMGQNGVLPSDIGNLTPGAQLEGVRSLLSLYGAGLGGLNHNRYETVGGVRMVSSYGNAAEAAQVAQMTGLTQTEVTRLMRETSGQNFNNVVQAMNVIGNPNAEGGEGSGLYSILNKSKSWQGLSQHERDQATRVWNAGIGRNIHHMGLTSHEITQIQDAHNVRQRASLLQRDLLGNQKNNPLNKITGSLKVDVDLSASAKRWLKVSANRAHVMMDGRAGGSSPNSGLNGPLSDAQAAMDGTYGVDLGHGFDPQISTPTPYGINESANGSVNGSG